MCNIVCDAVILHYTCTRAALCWQSVHSMGFASVNTNSLPKNEYTMASNLRNNFVCLVLRIITVSIS